MRFMIQKKSQNNIYRREQVRIRMCGEGLCLIRGRDNTALVQVEHRTPSHRQMYNQQAENECKQHDAVNGVMKR